MKDFLAARKSLSVAALAATRSARTNIIADLARKIVPEPCSFRESFKAIRQYMDERFPLDVTPFSESSCLPEIAVALDGTIPLDFVDRVVMATALLRVLHPNAEVAVTGRGYRKDDINHILLSVKDGESWIAVDPNHLGKLPEPTEEIRKELPKENP